MKKNVKYIKKMEVLDNFFGIVDNIKHESDLCGSVFGFFFDNEWIEFDWVYDHDIMKDVIEYLRNKDMTDLNYYFFIGLLNQPNFVYCDEKYKGMEIDDARTEFRFRFDDPDEHDILLKIDPNWYDKYF